MFLDIKAVSAKCASIYKRTKLFLEFTLFTGFLELLLKLNGD